MRKFAIVAVLAALTATLSGCWWGPGWGGPGGPGGGGPGGGGPGGPGGDGPHGSITVPAHVAQG
ncbi:hypothetical protein SAMN05444165_0337 [Paraburkholderia phenazinium]|jgi:class 4 POU domain transcription factor|uniref:Lipoprotein n=1 Tax=Paraburkholderia phenazinium TaxID=60549 RepID=A0A1N6FQS5_9BURK|nr:hypothetical protein SAMN05444165_0337 [Paraburkholderia phenazinium]